MASARKRHVLEFGRRVKRRRLELGLTQERVAERAGLHRTAIGLLERGERDPTLGTILRVAAVLDVDPGELVAGLRRYNG